VAKMSAWRTDQRMRLAAEAEVLKTELPHFTWYDEASATNATIRGEHTTTAGNTYRLCLHVTSNFPNSLPGLYVTSPCPLVGYGGKTIQSYGTSHTMHVWKPDWDNYAKLCHWKEEFWSPSNTLLSVLMKGMLWLEAFEVHCKTGKSIDEYSLNFR